MTDEVLLLAGTRPEALKVAPVALALEEVPWLRPVIVHSGQHVGMVEQALVPFGLRPDVFLPLRREIGSQAELVSALLPRLDELIVRRGPAAVLVQGDTSTALAGALAGYWRGVPVAHLEAGLRTGDLGSPFPEEGNRQMIARIAALHLAPTEAAARALRSESLPGKQIVVTGNTVVDALTHVAGAGLPARSPVLAGLERQLDAEGGRLVLTTLHRRESWGLPADRVLAAVRSVVDRHRDVHVLLPVHPNPAVRAQVLGALQGHDRIWICEPLDYPDLVRALRRSALVITDSGGIQEEAPSFGVPVLVVRDSTERTEAVDAGYAWLVGTDDTRIVAEADWVLSSGLRLPTGRNPFGDGQAAGRVVSALRRLLGARERELVGAG
ncbi:UDP-N-acetylglucosamine 2-epimerase (non-hydrolyzing) [Kutzneria viridogrisea]|uniref:UDP-N-acetylglucosamine 2-epimerase (non-hydrolyzing) n=1 Tax=Kutzneria viridogrisea TaxID=47990 RepID=A0ABR6BTN1_9PSEU|nr:UDP-N-acetylglucosamine 2-epimerase (non-hydrolyzing) [Kutzneria albida]MBA8930281.1 UDP-N-acetylglucosamine 2-epimerase (non-hydrolyzing) [Kutzneria viridogrisea]